MKLIEYITIYNFINKIVRKIKKLIKYQVYEAHSVMQGLYEEYKDTKSKEQIIELFKAALKNMRFLDGRGYFYIYDMKGNNIFHPILKFLEGRSLWDYKDITGKKIVQEGISVLKKQDETYDDWYWQEPKSKKVKRKIGFHKMFKPYNIFVGTGEYVEDFEHELKQSILQYISTIRYLDNRVISVMKNDGKLLTLNNEYALKNLQNLQTKSGFKPYKEMSLLAKKSKEGYISYKDTTEKNKEKFYEKTAFVKALDGWDWVIYASFYKDSLKKEINQRVKSLEEEDKKQ